ncbi:MAG TPA: hypothetical protein V6C63_21200 [Allocoleopsis sp.]
MTPLTNRDATIVDMCLELAKLGFDRIYIPGVAFNAPYIMCLVNPQTGEQACLSSLEDLSQLVIKSRIRASGENPDEEKFKSVIEKYASNLIKDFLVTRP